MPHDSETSGEASGQGRSVPSNSRKREISLRHFGSVNLSKLTKIVFYGVPSKERIDTMTMDEFKRKFTEIEKEMMEADPQNEFSLGPANL